MSHGPPERAPVARAVSFAIHATAALIGEGAVVLRGRSGAGKSGLALALIAAARARGRFARLVGDDRLLLRRAGARLIVSGHPAIAGRVERRFVGVTCAAFEAEALAVLVVDLAVPNAEPHAQADAAVPQRLPEDAEQWTELGGVRLPRLFLPVLHSGAVEAILHALDHPPDVSAAPVDRAAATRIGHGA